MAQPKIIAMICLSAVVFPGCSFLPSTKGPTGLTVNPEIATIPDAQQPAATKAVQAKLEAQFERSWQATLEVLQQFSQRLADPGVQSSEK